MFLSQWHQDITTPSSLKFFPPQFLRTHFFAFFSHLPKTSVSWTDSCLYQVHLESMGIYSGLILILPIVPGWSHLPPWFHQEAADSYVLYLQLSPLFSEHQTMPLGCPLKCELARDVRNKSLSLHPAPVHRLLCSLPTPRSKRTSSQQQQLMFAKPMYK